MRKTMVSIVCLGMVMISTQLYAHCEIPCGIYDDAMRITLMEEHITTIEKSMNMINDLSKESPVNYNQLIRWVTNKEEHSTKLQEIVTQYFMTQRIKYADTKDADQHNKYIMELTILHQILVNAMKTKQTTDLEYVQKLRSMVQSFRVSYLGEDPKEHHGMMGSKH